MSPALDPASILFEDHHLIVVNKPAPLLTQAPPEIPSLEAMVKAYIKVKYAKPAGVYLGIPHRLDRPVSGVIVFCRNTKAAQRLQVQFEKRTVSKTYWALVDGLVEPSEGDWEDWIRKVPDESRVEKTEANSPGSKFARLHYCVLKRNDDSSTLLELIPETGRTHQLRVQTAWRGFPIRGDALYGSTKPFGCESTDERERLIALHARQLELDHPFTKQRLTLVAPLPAYWNFGEPGA